MTNKEAMKLALDALVGARAFLESDAPVEVWGVNDKAITALREALAEQPAQQWQSTAGKCELEKVPANGSLLPAHRPSVRSPTKLRKMWSGSDMQAWY